MPPMATVCLMAAEDPLRTQDSNEKWSQRSRYIRLEDDTSVPISGVMRRLDPKPSVMLHWEIY